MIRESTADVIRRRRGMKPMDEVNDGLQQPDPADVQAAASMLQEQEPQTVEVPVEPGFEHPQQRPGSIPAQVGQSVTAAAPMEDNRGAEELAAAQDADRQARNAGRLELAGKQFVAGVTQTPQASMSAPAPSRVPQAQAAAKSRAERAAEAIRLKRQAEQDNLNREDKRAAATERSEALVRALRERDEKERVRLSERGEDIATRARNFAETKAMQHENMGLMAAMVGAKTGALDLATTKHEEDAVKKVSDEAQKFGNEMKGRGVMSKRLKDLEATIPKSGSVPGTGVLGDAVAWFDSKAGTNFQSPEALKVRQNIGLLMAAILREQSGATVSEQEYARAVQSGLSTKNAAATRAALKRLQEEFDLSEKEIRAKYSPEAVKTYEGRAGAQQGGGKPSPGPGYERYTNPDGWYNAKADKWVPD